MSDNTESIMEDQDLNTTSEAKTESEEVSETPSAYSDEVPPADTGHIGSDFWSSDDSWAATAIGDTPQGKTVQVVKRKDGQGYELNFRQGGERPQDLVGWFTSYDKAEQAARIYLNRLHDENK